MIVMPVEGFLTESADEIKGSFPSEEARNFYGVLVSSGQPVVLLSAQRNRRMVTEWLHIEGFQKYASIYAREDSPLIWPQFKMDRVRHLTAIGGRIQFYVDSDPTAVRQVTDMGIPALLLVAPGKRLGRVSSEEQSYTPWDSLVDRIETRSTVQAEHRKRLLDVQSAED
jgi:hypothetical protein